MASPSFHLVHFNVLIFYRIDFAGIVFQKLIRILAIQKFMNLLIVVVSEAGIARRRTIASCFQETSDHNHTDQLHEEDSLPRVAAAFG